MNAMRSVWSNGWLLNFSSPPVFFPADYQTFRTGFGCDMGMEGKRSSSSSCFEIGTEGEGRNGSGRRTRVPALGVYEYRSDPEKNLTNECRGDGGVLLSSSSSTSSSRNDARCFCFCSYLFLFCWAKNFFSFFFLNGGELDEGGCANGPPRIFPIPLHSLFFFFESLFGAWRRMSTFDWQAKRREGEACYEDGSVPLREMEAQKKTRGEERNDPCCLLVSVVGRARAGASWVLEGKKEKKEELPCWSIHNLCVCVCVLCLALLLLVIVVKAFRESMHGFSMESRACPGCKGGPVSYHLLLMWYLYLFMEENGGLGVHEILRKSA